MQITASRGLWFLGLLWCFSCSEQWWGPVEDPSSCDPGAQAALQEPWRRALEGGGRVRGCLQVSWVRSQGQSRTLLVELASSGKVYGPNPQSEAFDQSPTLPLPEEARSKARRFRLFIFPQSLQGREGQARVAQEALCQGKMSQAGYECGEAECWFYFSFRPSGARETVPLEEGKTCTLTLPSQGPGEIPPEGKKPSQLQVSTVAGPPSRVTGAKEQVYLQAPQAMAVDPKSGAIYVVEEDFSRIRKIDGQGQVTVFAGGRGCSPWQRPCAADGKGTAARFYDPKGIAFDANSGALYVADTGNHMIRKISLDGAVTTLAGDERGGFVDGKGKAARFRSPTSIAIDAQGNLYVADSSNHAIRKLAPDGTVTTLAGHCDFDDANGTCTPGNREGAGKEARFSRPYGVVLTDPKTLLVTDSNNHQIKRITLQGEVSVYAGKGPPGIVNGALKEAQFSRPLGLAYRSKALYVVDELGNTLRKIDMATEDVSTLAGHPSKQGYADEKGASALFSSPTGLAFLPNGTLLIADVGNSCIRSVDLSSRQVGTYAGFPIQGRAQGRGRQVRFRRPIGLAFGPKGDLYIADSRNHQIRKMTPNGTVSSIAGIGQAHGYRNDPTDPLKSLFDQPADVFVKANGDILVADQLNHRIRQISKGVTTTLAGSGKIASPNQGASIDGTGEKASFGGPVALRGLANGDLLVAGSLSSCIRQVTPTRQVTTLACLNNLASHPSDLVPLPDGIAISDFINAHVLLLSKSEITTYAGAEKRERGYLDGPLKRARFASPWGLDIDAQGNLYVADSSNHAIRKISPDGTVTTLAGDCDARGCYPGYRDGDARSARFFRPVGLTLGPDGSIYVSELGNHAIRKISSPAQGN